MSNCNNFQDWETVVLRKRSSEIKKQSIQTTLVNRNSIKNKPKDIEYPSDLEYISKTLASKINQLRLSFTLDRQSFATKVGLSLSDIKSLEERSILLKPAKEKILKIEKILKVKILSNEKPT